MSPGMLATSGFRPFSNPCPASGKQALMHCLALKAFDSLGHAGQIALLHAPAFTDLLIAVNPWIVLRCPTVAALVASACFLPLVPCRIRHTIVLDDPFPDPPMLADHIPDASPEPQFADDGRLEDDWVPQEDSRAPEEIEKATRWAGCREGRPLR